MAFDPDKYLAETAPPVAQTLRTPPGVSQGFDPDKYLAETAPAADQSGKSQTALEHGANALTLGYLPQLQAAAAPYIYKGLNAITGQNVQPDSYVNERDQNIKRMDQEQQDNPKTALASQIGGGLVGAALVPGGAAAEGIGGAAVQGARYGAAYGLLQNPGDTEGEVNPLQLKDRVENAGKGLATGAVTGAVTKGASKILQGVASAPESLKSLGETQAVKSTGAMLKDFRALEGSGRTNDLGRYLLDRGIVKSGDTLETVAGKASAHNEQAGMLLDDVYNTAAKALKDPEAVASMPGFNPVRDKDEILKEISTQLGNQTGKKAAVEKVGAYLDQLAEDHGDKVLDPRAANDVKTEIDKTINYLRNPLTKEPAGESAYKATRGVLAKKIEAGVDFLGKLVGDDNLAQRLKSANQEYGMSKQAASMAKDRLNRIDANKMITLTDSIAGGAGGVAGAGVGAALGGDYKHAGEMGLIGAGIGALTHHVGARYGNAALAGGLDTAGDMARYTASPLAKGMLAVSPNSGLLTRGLLEAKALSDAKNKKRGLTAPEPGMLSGGE